MGPALQLGKWHSPQRNGHSNCNPARPSLSARSSGGNARTAAAGSAALTSNRARATGKARLPVGSQGGPMTYVSPKTGKQYVVITAGGARQSTDRGDYVMAYALP